MAKRRTRRKNIIINCCCLSNLTLKKNAGIGLLFLVVVLIQSASFRKFSSPSSFTSTSTWLEGAAVAGDNHQQTAVVLLPPKKSNNHDNYEDLHSTSQAILDLLDWEIASLKKPYNQSTCQHIVPKGVDEVCCLGTQSHTGKIKISRRHLCDHLSLEDYKQIQTQLLQQQHEHDVTTTSTGTMACDVCQIVELLRQHNPRQLKFAFFGDSLTNQVEQGMVCELQRRNYVVTLQPDVEYPQRKGDPFRTIIEYRRRLIRSPLWADSEPSVVMDFMFQYRLPLLYKEQRELIVNTYDIVIFNMGLHWVYSYDDKDEQDGNEDNNKANKKKKKKKKNRWTRDTLGRQLKDFFTLIKNTGKVQLLAYRETTATHFDAKGGDYSLARRFNPTFDTSRCVPLQEDNDDDVAETVVSKWREPIVRQAAIDANYTIVETGRYMKPKTNHQQYASVSEQDHRYQQQQDQEQHQQEMYIIPYYDFTSQYWLFHPHREGPNGAHLDCSHYCSSPYLFQPIWFGIRKAMDREFAFADTFAFAASS